MSDEGTTLFHQALELHQAGELEKAEPIYRHLLADEAQAPAAWHYLGIIALQLGHAAEALRRLHIAVAFAPSVATFHGNLGEALAPTNLHAAARSYERAIASDPSFASGYGNLIGRCEPVMGTERLLRLARRHVALAPGSGAAQSNLGLLLCNYGMLGPATKAAERAVAIEPASAPIMSNLGRVYAVGGRQDEALSALDAAMRLDPTLAGSHNNLGRTRYRAGRIADARLSLRRAVALEPALADAIANLSNVAHAFSDAETATVLCRRALVLSPSSAGFRSNLVMALLYRDHTTPADLFAAAGGRGWSGTPRTIAASSRVPETTPLRLGFVSADLCVHPVGDTLLTIIEAIDRRSAKVILYANVKRPDAMTRRFQDLADGWRTISGMPDEAVAQRIRDDKVDVLISVAGHTAEGRLPVFALRPAPVQVALFDLTTTGLSEVDYWIGDEATTPADTPERFSEQLIRLPGWTVFRRPPPDPAPGPLAMSTAGHVTFGSFNNPAKFSPDTLSTWAAIMRAVPSSRLLLKYLKAYEDPEVRESIGAGFRSRGVSADRIDFETGAVSLEGHLDAYGRIDIALDPFPFVGCNATFEALWMGVPVVTLRGSRFMARVGAGFLPLVGLEHLVAGDTASYVAIATSLARDGLELATLRNRLRSRVSSSRLCDAGAYADSLVAALRKVRRS